jgi:hypothetical protein
MPIAATQAVNFLTPDMKSYNFIFALLPIIAPPARVPSMGERWIAHSLKDGHLEKLFPI